MSKTIENITNPGQPLAHGDVYKLVDSNGTFKLKQWRIKPDDTAVEPIRKITTQAFYRRLEVGERNALRNGTTDEIEDMRNDLARSPFLDLDGAIEAQLLSVGTNQTRVDELLVDGTDAETETG